MSLTSWIFVSYALSALTAIITNVYSFSNVLSNCTNFHNKTFAPDINSLFLQITKNKKN